MTDKKADTWMPLWIGAYLGDTTELTTVQHGAYFLLLLSYWRKREALPDNDEKLRAITKCSPAEWKRMRPTLAEFFKVADGVWWHKRVEAEMLEADKRANAASGKAKAAAEARWGKSLGNAQGTAKGNAPSMPGALPKQCPPPTPLPQPTVDSVPDGTADGSAATTEKPPTASMKSPEELSKAVLWKAAVSLLDGQGMPEPQARAFIGKLSKDFPDGETVMDAVREAVAAQPADARSWLTAACQRAAGRRPPAARKPTSHTGLADRNYSEGVNIDGTFA